MLLIGGRIYPWHEIWGISVIMTVTLQYLSSCPTVVHSAKMFHTAITIGTMFSDVEYWGSAPPTTRTGVLSVELISALYLAVNEAEKRWTVRTRDWPKIMAQLSVYFQEKLDNVLAMRNTVYTHNITPSARGMDDLGVFKESCRSFIGFLF